jgi:hypothetical protein
MQVFVVNRHFDPESYCLTRAGIQSGTCIELRFELSLSLGWMQHLVESGVNYRSLPRYSGSCLHGRRVLNL